MSISWSAASLHRFVRAGLSAFAASLLLAAAASAQGPILTFGGPGDDRAHAVAVAPDGGTVVVGEFWGTVDFDPGPGVVTRTSDVNIGALFVARYDPSGASVSVDTRGGRGYGVAFAPNGDVVVAGDFAFQPNGAFVVRYSPGGAVVSTVTVPGARYGTGGRLAVDASGNAVVCGSFVDTVDFDPGAGVESRTSLGSGDAFLARYGPSGAFVSVVTFGGPTFDECRGVALTATGDAVVTGRFAGTVDFDPGPGVENRTSNDANTDAFLARYSPGGAFVSAVALNGVGADGGFGLAVDASDGVVIAGSFQATVDFDPGPGTENRTATGNPLLDDVFVARYDAGGAFVSVAAFGGPTSDYGHGVALDADGNAVVTGIFERTADFDPGPGTATRTSAGFYDVFVARFTPAGAFVSVAAVGGTDIDASYGVAVDAGGNAVVTGYFRGTADFDPGPGADPRTSAGNYDVFVARYGADGLITAGDAAPGASSLALAVGPNPAGASATLRFALAAPQTLRVTLTDVLGRTVLAFDRTLGAGAHALPLDVAGLAPGVYVARVVSPGASASARLTVAR